MIPAQLDFTGDKKEFQFRDHFVMPLLVRLGFGIVVNNHGTREFGRDVIFGDIDRFGHLVYYGMQIKYESSIGLGDSHSLIQDAEQATNNPFRHPQTGREEFISTFYVGNAGNISDQARDNFFNTLPRKGIRDARLLDGNALLLLDRIASLNRNANVKERLAGLLQEVRRNRNLIPRLITDTTAHADDPSTNSFPFQRCRNTATAAYLNAPFTIPNLSVNILDQYFEMVRMFNAIVESIGIPITFGDFRKQRAAGLGMLAPDMDKHGGAIESAAMSLLTQLGENV